MVRPGFSGEAVFETAFFTATFLTEAFFAAGFLIVPACFDVSPRPELFVAVRFASDRAETVLLDRKAGFLAAIFFTVVVPVRAGFLLAVPAVDALRAGAVFRAVPFVIPVAALTVVRDFLDVADGAFGRETLTSPRMARPLLAVGLEVARPVDLLRGVEAMGSTLGTVET